MGQIPMFPQLTLFFLALFLVQFQISLASYCALPPPKTPYGFTFNPSSKVKPITIDLIGDLQCPDTLAIWDTFKAIGFKFNQQVEFRFFIFPLPYHHQTWLATRAVQVMNDLYGEEYIWPFIDYIFSHQSQLYDSATMNKTQYEMIETFVNWASVSTEKDLNINKSKFLSEMLTNHNIDVEARMAWKYQCVRGTFETPTFYVNDLCLDSDLNGGPGSWNVDDWTKYIQSLLSSHSDM